MKQSRLLNLKQFISHRQCSLLFVGPMSHNVVDASLELANKFRVPLGFVASRRQIEASDLGGGYVGWSTESFIDYVRERDTHHLITIARDHGGPWQGNRVA